ncbi:MAG: hypothetical protein ACR2JO_07880 [Mycobacteriales bacterium]
MNNHAKRCIKNLEALGFYRDHDAQTRGLAYRHPNAPDQVLKVFDQMTDSTITSVIRKANKIADTGWSGPRQPETVKERARVTHSKNKSQWQREDEARRARAEVAERAHEDRSRTEVETEHRREVEDLMQPGYGR